MDIEDEGVRVAKKENVRAMFADERKSLAKAICRASNKVIKEREK